VFRAARIVRLRRRLAGALSSLATIKRDPLSCWWPSPGAKSGITVRVEARTERLIAGPVEMEATDGLSTSFAWMGKALVFLDYESSLPLPMTDKELDAEIARYRFYLNALKQTQSEK
jgi:hypothetical protein